MVAHRNLCIFLDAIIAWKFVYVKQKILTNNKPVLVYTAFLELAGYLAMPAIIEKNKPQSTIFLFFNHSAVYISLPFAWHTPF
jgi:hypothetical protein